MAITNGYLWLAISLLLLTFVQYTTQSKPNPSSFSFLKSLEGCKKGKIVDGLHQLKFYLAKFGYLENLSSVLVSEDEVTNIIKENDDDYFDDNLEKAIKTYQLNYKLSVTGYLDAVTVKHMMITRYVSTDIINGTNTIQKCSDGRLLYAYVHGLKWPPSKYNLTYRIRYSTLVPGAHNMKSIVAEALGKWAQHSPFTFREVAESTSSNLVFGFFKGNHGDGHPFDGPLGVLAHSFFPCNGRSHYDADENWSDNPGKNEHDLNSVVLHEIGHLLGLRHSQDPSAVMHLGLARGVRRRELQKDDIQGIQALYGST